MSDPNQSAFLEFCTKVRNNDLSLLPAPGEPFRIDHLSENEVMELADALLENTNVTYLALETEKYTKSYYQHISQTKTRILTHLKTILVDFSFVYIITTLSLA
jgi:hypothetical protein